MIKAIYPGSFDPVTLGHLDIIRRSAELVDELVIGILVNKGKHPMFSKEERLNMLQECTKDIPNVTVKTFDGLTIDFAKQEQARIMIRGLRAVTDYENEMQIAQTNRTMNPEIETMFMATSLEYSFLSSTIVREVASYGADVSRFVPKCVEDRLIEKYRQQNK